MKDENFSLSTLKAVVWVCLAVGVVLMVFGFVGHDQPGRPSYLDPIKETSYGPLVVGSVLVGIAFQGWLLLLLFWALQHDRATRASYVAPPASDPKVSTPVTIPNRVQRDAVDRQAAAKVPMTWPEE